MERLIITIHPAESDEGMLGVSDAMQQVLDLIRLYEQADQGGDDPDSTSYVWRLESASTNSPFRISALAEARDLVTDVTPRVQRAKAAVSSGLRGLVERNELAPWMGREAMAVARSMFARNQNGIGLTEIAFDDQNRLVINRGVADSGIRAIEAIDPTSLDVVVGSREAWGEIQGTMVAAGRYKNKAAVQMLTDQYGAVWCQLSDREVHDLGDNVKIGTVWEGKTIGVEGRLMYSAVGKLLILDAKVRIVADVPLISLESVLDPDFTSGLDPVEYLRLFHEGELAG
jgi:hypothetical protein